MTGTYVPSEAEIGLALADAYALGDVIDALRSTDDPYGAITDYELAAARTPADADTLADAYAAGLAVPTAPVIELTRWQRAPQPPRGRQRAA